MVAPVIPSVSEGSGGRGGAKTHRHRAAPRPDPSLPLGMTRRGLPLFLLDVTSEFRVMAPRDVPGQRPAKASRSGEVTTAVRERSRPGSAASTGPDREPRSGATLSRAGWPGISRGTIRPARESQETLLTGNGTRGRRPGKLPAPSGKRTQTAGSVSKAGEIRRRRGERLCGRVETLPARLRPLCTANGALRRSAGVRRRLRGALPRCADLWNGYRGPRSEPVGGSAGSAGRLVRVAGGRAGSLGIAPQTAGALPPTPGAFPRRAGAFPVVLGMLPVSLGEFRSRRKRSGKARESFAVRAERSRCRRESFQPLRKSSALSS